jgi:hypothetical protein
MRLVALAFVAAVLPLTVAFAPSGVVVSSSPRQWQTTDVMQLQAESSRREALFTVARLMIGSGLVVALPRSAEAKGSTFFYDEKIEFVKEPQQMATDGKVDLNAAFVVGSLAWKLPSLKTKLTHTRLMIISAVSILL